MPNPTAEVWITLGHHVVSSERHEFVIAGWSKTREEALTKTGCREIGVQEFADIEVVLASDFMGSVITGWLTKLGVPAAERPKIIRALGQEMLKCFQ